MQDFLSRAISIDANVTPYFQLYQVPRDLMTPEEKEEQKTFY